MQLGSLTLRNRLVGRVADQDVPEAKAVVAGHGCPIGPDQLLTHQGEEMSADLVSRRLGQELRHGASVE